MTVEQLLKAARDRYAANPDHCPADEFPKGECPLTSLHRSTMIDPYSNLFPDAYMRLIEVLPEDAEGLPQYNAEHTTEEVVALFNKAIDSVV